MESRNDVTKHMTRPPTRRMALLNVDESAFCTGASMPYTSVDNRDVSWPVDVPSKNEMSCTAIDRNNSLRSNVADAVAQIENARFCSDAKTVMTTARMPKRRIWYQKSATLWETTASITAPWNFGKSTSAMVRMKTSSSAATRYLMYGCTKRTLFRKYERVDSSCSCRTPLSPRTTFSSFASSFLKQSLHTSKSHLRQLYVSRSLARVWHASHQQRGTRT